MDRALKRVLDQKELTVKVAHGHLKIVITCLRDAIKLISSTKKRRDYSPEKLDALLARAMKEMATARGFLSTAAGYDIARELMEEEGE